MASFLWCGRPIRFETGETVAAALIRAGFVALGEAGGGRIFCGIGACQNCLVRDRSGAAFEACITPARSGLDLWPSLGAVSDE